MTRQPLYAQHEVATSRPSNQTENDMAGMAEPSARSNHLRTVAAARGGIAAAGGQAGAEGARSAIHLGKHHPEVAVLVMSHHAGLGLDIQLVARSAEGIGCLLKDRIGDVNEFLTAAQIVADGGSAIEPKIAGALTQRRRGENLLASLTPREREVLELMATGTSNQGIADKMVITTRAVEKYVSSIFDKLGIPSTRKDSRRVMAVLFYLRS